MYGIKLYIHEKTPTVKMSKTLKILFLINAVLFYFMFALGAFCVAYYAHKILPAVLLLVCPLIFFAIIFLPILDSFKPYIVFTKTTVEEHTFILGIHRVKRFNISDVSEILNCSGNSFKVKGTCYKLLQYLVFRNADGKYMFKLAVFPNAEETVRQIFPNIEIKEIS